MFYVFVLLLLVGVCFVLAKTRRVGPPCDARWRLPNFNGFCSVGAIAYIVTQGQVRFLVFRDKRNRTQHGSSLPRLKRQACLPDFNSLFSCSSLIVPRSGPNKQSFTS